MAKIVEKTRRNGDIWSERKVVSASIRPTAPMPSSVRSAATSNMPPPSLVMPANKAIAAAMATPMLKGFTTAYSPLSVITFSSRLCQHNRWLGSETTGRLTRWPKSRTAATDSRW